MAISVGIDIGTTAVKVAAVRASYRKVILTSLVAVEVGEGGVEAAIKKAVSAAVLGGVRQGDSVAIALPGTRAVVRTLRVPSSAQRQLNEVLKFELEAQVPLDVPQTVFDYVILPRDPERKNELNIQCAVAEIADVRERITLVRTATGVEPERVGIGSYSLAPLVNVTPALASGEVVVVLDLGVRTSEVMIVQDGQPTFARTLSLGTEGLPASASHLAREIRMSISAHRAAGGEAPVRVYLCGGGAAVSGAEGFLSSALDLPVQMLPDPVLELAAGVNFTTTPYGRFAKAIGLALSVSGGGAGFNLRRGALTFERGFAWMQERTPVLVGLFAFVFVTFLFATASQLYAISKEHDILEKALGDVTAEVLGEATTDPSRTSELVAQQSEGTDEDPMPHVDAYDVLVKISQAVPASMVHDIDELDIQKGHVVIHGIVGSIPDAQSIATALSGDACFNDVKVTRTNQAVGADRQKYVIEFDLRCPEDAKGPKKKEVAAAPGGSTTGGGK